MNKNLIREGSALLILVLIMTVVSLLAQQLLRSRSFNYNVALVRTQYYKQQWALQALLRYANALVVANKKTISDQSVGKQYSFPIGVPLHDGTLTDCVLEIERVADGAKVTVTMKEKNSTSMSCLLAINDTGIVVKKWN